jgi:spore coat polysaccharide biosynthesis protein SpsF
LKGIFITVRSGSTRLPNKALKKINGIATIEHLIHRIKKSKKFDKIIICTTRNTADDEICKLAKKNSIFCYRGSVEDKLDRVLKAAKKHNIDFFVNVDGDDLFCEPELIDLAFDQYEKDNSDFIKIDDSKIICGAFTFAIKTKILEEICRKKQSKNTEAAWLLFENELFFRTCMLKNIPRVFFRPEIRATLDYEEDLKFFKYFFNNLQEGFSLRDVVDHIDKNPDILKINAHKHLDYLQNQKILTEEYRKKCLI